MPVRPWNSSVLVWPSREQVLVAARAYADLLFQSEAGVLRVGLVGSYARGDQGPGSDADLLIVLECSSEPPFRRALALPPPSLPVPVDLLVLTVEEIARLGEESPRWVREVLNKALWLGERVPNVAPAGE